LREEEGFERLFSESLVRYTNLRKNSGLRVNYKGLIEVVIRKALVIKGTFQFQGLTRGNSRLGEPNSKFYVCCIVLHDCDETMPEIRAAHEGIWGYGFRYCFIEFFA